MANIAANKFEQISDGQLLSRLKEGWQIVHKLANGEIIIKRWRAQLVRKSY